MNVRILLVKDMDPVTCLFLQEQIFMEVIV